MADQFTQREFAQLQNAINLMVRATAVEIPIGADVVDALTIVAFESGYFPALGFKTAVMNAPISTILLWLAYMGDPGPGYYDLLDENGGELVAEDGTQLVSEHI